MKILLAGAAGRGLVRLKSGLAQDGTQILLATRSVQVWRAALEEHPELIVVHAGAASRDFQPMRLVEELCSVLPTPLIVLTRAGRNHDRRLAFQRGAMQCLTLPASAGELRACLRAVLGNGTGAAAARRGPGTELYADAHLRIDFGRREIRREGRVYALTGRESPLLQKLVERAGRIVSNQELCERVWSTGAWPHKRSLLRMYIVQLRRKIERDARRPRYIISHRGLGYTFVPQFGTR